MSLDTPTELKPLKAFLLNLEIGWYLQTKRFENLMIEHDYDRHWSAAIMQNVDDDIIYIGDTYVHDAAIMDLLLAFWEKDKYKFHEFLSILLIDFINTQKSSLNITKLGTILEKLNHPKDKIEELFIVNTKDKQTKKEASSDVLITLHPDIQKIVGKLYQDGHYRGAILDSYIHLVERVKEKSGRKDLEGTQLMQTVFSPKNPILKISNDTDEQQGMMYLFTGAVSGIRNPKAHRLIEQKDPQRTLEWLSFASVLLKIIDDSTLNT